MRVDRTKLDHSRYGSQLPPPTDASEWWEFRLIDDREEEVGSAELAIGYVTDITGLVRSGPYLSVHELHTDNSMRWRYRPILTLLTSIFDFALELILADRIIAIRFEPHNPRVARFILKRVGGRTVGYPPYDYVLVDRDQLLLTTRQLD